MKKIMFNDKYGLTNAVLSGYKTVTRRIMNRQPDPDDIAYMEPKDYPCQPTYKVGEIVAVAQSYDQIDPQIVHCRIDDLGDWGGDHPGQYNKMFVRADLMPHQIRITSVRPERLQNITDEDCLKEGLEWQHGANMFYVNYNHTNNSRELLGDTPREAFASLIDKISGRGTWERNPYVWRIEFELVK